MTDKELQDMADVYGLYTQIDLDNHIAHVNELLNRSNLRLAEEQIKNNELQKQCDAQKVRIEELEKQLEFANRTCDNCDNYYCAEWAEGIKCHSYGCRNKSKWEPKRRIK